MAANADAMVREAMQAYRSGKKAEARALLEKATEIDQYNEQAWMWLSAVVDSPEDQRTCLENVLYINPNNENAKRGLQMLEAKLGSSAAPMAASTDDDDDDDESDWANTPPTATSSASARYNPANDISSSQLDDWVAGLQLRKQDEQEIEEEEISDDSFSSLFADAFEDDTESDEDDAAFSRLDDMFSGSTPTTAPAKPKAPSGSTGPFSGSDFGFDDFEEEEADFLTSLDLPEVPPAPSKPKSAVMSPGREEPPAARPASASRKPETKSKPPKPAPKPAPKASSSFYTGKETTLDVELDPGEYFKEIPAEIRATRLPGTGRSGGGSSRLMLVGLVVLVLLNLGAGALLVMNLAG
ncbi:MAG: hypothetical protein SF029_10585 [bacterium]|nr:hypothetical protein [bacterium]